jgi:serine/threonine protein kinase
MAAQAQLLSATSRYELLERIPGNAADCWKARDRHTGRFVTIRTLSHGARFRTACLPFHPNIATVLDAGDLTVGGQATPFLSTPYPSGSLLADLQGSLTQRQLVKVMCDICQGLEAAEQAGVVIQLSPENIVVNADFQAYLIDLSPATGLPDFSAPEVVAGMEPTPAASVYSLAVIGNKLLAGQGTARLNAVICQGMSPQPNDRPNAAEFAESLQSALAATHPIEKAELLAKREPLLDASFIRPLSPLEQAQLAVVERRIDEIEQAESDEFELGYSQSRAGRLEGALDRLEAATATIRAMRFKTA